MRAHTRVYAGGHCRFRMNSNLVKRITFPEFYELVHRNIAIATLLNVALVHCQKERAHTHTRPHSFCDWSHALNLS